ncbi:MAG: L-seryl-tRNA(Sec) selenium transferase [Caldilineaceae bacterium]|nr:L-seryl-tRNA(Sec) selenium transferase [Caldilineaceae bacterium]
MPGQANGFDTQTEYRKLPAVDALLQDSAVAVLIDRYGPGAATAAIRTVLNAARQLIAAGNPAPQPDEWPARLAAWLEQAHRPTLRPVLNATGVIIHTNLGRAPLSQAAFDAMLSVAQGYSNLEYDLEQGARGSRYDHARSLLGQLTGAEDALVVNNNAAAIFLALSALCQGRQVLISRGQLVEIGGGFRIPDVLRQSGAQLVEVGTTNRTHLRDFAEAITPQTAAIMRVHSSNFRQIGFVTLPELNELAQLVQRHNQQQPEHPLMLIDDLGSGTLLDTAPYGLAPEPTVPGSLTAGADLVTFSGDKLLGGPQAGLLLGRNELISRARRHPLARALRVDKLTLAALDATLRSYQRGRATEEIPVWRMISVAVDELGARVLGWQNALRAHGVEGHIMPGESAIGGGSLPGETLPTVLLTIAHPQPDQAAAALRHGHPPAVCRIQHDHLCFDPRTILPEQDETLLAAIIAAFNN